MKSASRWTLQLGEICKLVKSEKGSGWKWQVWKRKWVKITNSFSKTYSLTFSKNIKQIHPRFHNVDKSPTTRPVLTHTEGVFGDVRIVYSNEQHWATVCVEKAGGCAANNSLRDACAWLKTVPNGFDDEEVAALLHRRACTGVRAFFAVSMAWTKHQDAFSGAALVFKPQLLVWVNFLRGKMDPFSQILISSYPPFMLV